LLQPPKDNFFGAELTFTRLYNSQDEEETGIFGKDWRFNPDHKSNEKGTVSE